MNKSLESFIIPSTKTAIGSVIWLHGLGADGYDFADIVPKLNLLDTIHLRFIFPHAPIKPITINANMRMRAWYDIYSLSDLTVEDEKGMLHTTQSLYELIELEMINGISSERIILAGFSQGGAMALYAGLRYQNPLGGIIALSSYLPLADKLSKEASESNKNIPIFMAHGDNDSVLPSKLGFRSYQLLKQQDYPVEWHSYPIDHHVSLEEIKSIGKWLTNRFSQTN